MSEQDEESDKQYEPSQKKLDDARKEGEIPRSADLTTAAAYAGFVLVALSAGPAGLMTGAAFLAELLARADSFAAMVFGGGGHAFHAGLLVETGQATIAWFAGPALCAILMVMVQRAFLFTPKKVAPKLDRISPISGIKNKFGRQGLFEFVKSTAKLLIYCAVLGLFLVGQIDAILGSAFLTPRQSVVVLGRMILQVMMIVVVIAAILGGIDYLWQQAEHQRKNRMSRKELTDEVKQSEGDPHLKQERRQRGMQIAANQMMQDVPKADVIIVNPTHYAVALRWDAKTDAAPVCLAKGVDTLAARIRDVAQDHNIPVHSDPPTARALFAEIEVGAQVSPDHYRAVAAAIRFAETMRRKARR